MEGSVEKASTTANRAFLSSRTQTLFQRHFINAIAPHLSAFLPLTYRLEV